MNNIVFLLNRTKTHSNLVYWICFFNALTKVYFLCHLDVLVTFPGCPYFTIFSLFHTQPHKHKNTHNHLKHTTIQHTHNTHTHKNTHKKTHTQKHTHTKTHKTHTTYKNTQSTHTQHNTYKHSNLSVHFHTRDWTTDQWTNFLNQK